MFGESGLNYSRLRKYAEKNTESGYDRTWKIAHTGRPLSENKKIADFTILATSRDIGNDNAMHET